jgi:hypothetical protein
LEYVRDEVPVRRGHSLLEHVLVDAAAGGGFAVRAGRLAGIPVAGGGLLSRLSGWARIRFASV